MEKQYIRLKIEHLEYKIAHYEALGNFQASRALRDLYTDWDENYIEEEKDKYIKWLSLDEQSEIEPTLSAKELERKCYLIELENIDNDPRMQGDHIRPGWDGDPNEY